jgi:hypothetical protein
MRSRGGPGRAGGSSCSQNQSDLPEPGSGASRLQDVSLVAHMSCTSSFLSGPSESESVILESLPELGEGGGKGRLGTFS